MNKTRFLQWMSIGMLIILAACQTAGAPFSATVAEPVDAVQGVTLASGAAEAVPLWAYCAPSQENTHIPSFECRAPAGQALAIGHLFLLADSAVLDERGEDLTWELSIDDYLVDLESYGTFDYVMPAMPKGPSPIREVFVSMTDWNLVMTNLNPGEHTLFFRAQDSAGYYHEWLVYLTIEGEDANDISAAPFPLHS